MLRLLTDQRGQAHAVESWHVQVHQDQVWSVLGDRLLHFFCLQLHLCVHAGTVENALCEQRLRAVVLDDQDTVGVFLQLW